ncbi:flavin monoamine oxidase family protein [Parasphingorhabdus cellanae]|uniref:Tryptophan 2-monooxygenase n=1 Tax=Parasphingorhabdus cellanae TaxID=2806553 RepID=A0ABX7T0V1_9SPHN|nr:NAD(P)/FAD-dependent oxidoreductase [Parasphingorhabdus cellanae]QTD55174.1 FAD-dependent oxidoreductase [Parasphingorhabdus cellanae]
MSNQANRISRRAFVGGLSASLLAGAAPRRTWSKTTADVIVIGAGLAGLHAASLMEKAGYRVIVLEGAGHVGGRLHTLDDLPGKPDAGGIQIGAGYQRFHAIADQLGVERYVPPPSGRGALYHIGGTSMTAKQWPKAMENILSETEKAIPPDRLLFSYLKNLPKFENIADWMQPEHQTVDMALSQYLRDQGASAEALRLINANLNGNSIDQQSALHWARSLAIFRMGGGPTRYVRGGTQRMTNAMAASLRSEILLNSAVMAIQDEGDGVEIALTDGRKYGARHIICTAPFSALRSIRIEADLPPDLRMMIARLPYTKASFAYLAASAPFWKSDGLPETIWSDDPMLGRMFVLGDDPAMVKIWLNGPSADLVDAMDDATAGAAIIRKIETARPSAKGKLKFLRMFSWQKNPFARGIYHHIGAGQGSALVSATRHRGRRLHFAGEHLAQHSSGMEGALESGQRTAAHVLENL